MSGQTPPTKQPFSLPEDATRTVRHQFGIREKWPRFDLGSTQLKVPVCNAREEGTGEGGQKGGHDESPEHFIRKPSEPSGRTILGLHSYVFFTTIVKLYSGSSAPHP